MILKSKTTRRLSRAHRRKLSAIRKGSLNPFYGKKHRPEVRAMLAANLKWYRENRTYDIHPRTVHCLENGMIAYLAGLIDGEGSISFKSNQPTIYVYNNSFLLMGFLRKSIGGSIIKRKRRNPKWKQNYIWSIGGVRNVAYLLAKSMPYLIVKRLRAEEMLAILKHKYGIRIWEEIQT